eukprot:361921-Chlamydomonas_euryale.AAC.18
MASCLAGPHRDVAMEYTKAVMRGAGDGLRQGYRLDPGSGIHGVVVVEPAASTLEWRWDARCIADVVPFLDRLWLSPPCVRCLRCIAGRPVDQYRRGATSGPRGCRQPGRHRHRKGGRGHPG